MAIFDHLTTAILKFWPWSWSKIFDHLTMTPGRKPNGQKIVVILPPPNDIKNTLDKKGEKVILLAHDLAFCVYAVQNLCIPLSLSDLMNRFTFLFASK